MRSSRALVQSILLYLDRCAKGKHNASYRDSINLAASVVSLAAAGQPKPFELAFVRQYGTLYKKALVRWAEQRAKIQKELHGAGEVFVEHIGWVAPKDFAKFGTLSVSKIAAGMTPIEKVPVRSVPAVESFAAQDATTKGNGRVGELRGSSSDRATSAISGLDSLEKPAREGRKGKVAAQGTSSSPAIPDTPLPPKKPPQSVKKVPRRKRSA